MVLEAAAEGLCPLPYRFSSIGQHRHFDLRVRRAKANWLPAMASGEAVVTLGLYDEANWIDPAAITASASPQGEGFILRGKKPFVNDALAADYLLLAVQGPHGLALAALGKDQVTVTAQPTIDSTKPMASVDLDGVEISAGDLLPMSEEQLAYLTDCGGVATTAEMVGAGAAILALTNSYAKERIQFGKPIGQYQGVKHRLADMFVDLESYRSLCYFAAWTVDDSPRNLPRPFPWPRVTPRMPSPRSVSTASAYTGQLVLPPTTTPSSISNDQSGPARCMATRITTWTELQL